MFILPLDEIPDRLESQIESLIVNLFDADFLMLVHFFPYLLGLELPRASGRTGYTLNQPSKGNVPCRIGGKVDTGGERFAG